MKVQDVMIPVVGHVSPDDSLRDAAEQMKALNLSPMPVVEDGRIVGMLTEQILLDHVRTDGLAIGTHRVADAMSSDVVCCSETELVEEALHKVEEGHTARLPVINDQQCLVGIVSIDDLKRGLQVDAGKAPGHHVESVAERREFEEDTVDFMSDGSFPASDPLPPPTTLGTSQKDCD